MLPEKSQGKVLQATVVAVGAGSRGKVQGDQPVAKALFLMSHFYVASLGAFSPRLALTPLSSVILQWC